MTYCFEAVIEKLPDGTIICPILACGGECSECYETLERRMNDPRWEEWNDLQNVR